ncbi:hypothetical protein GGF32_001616 [Allomyces javanicus]|nr:hypothetical protein GGF32_001616 [Allomyces javanicus]
MSNPNRLPESYYACDTAYLIHMIADMLITLTQHNDQIPINSTNLTRFHSRAAPSISIPDYLRRIVRYASVERACLLAVLVYIDRICEAHPTFTISSLTVHRFIATAITVAAKAICDSYCTNSHYARVGGIQTAELNTLELEFLFLVDWHVACPAETLQGYYHNLVHQHVAYELAEAPSPPPLGTMPDTLPDPEHAPDDPEAALAAAVAAEAAALEIPEVVNFQLDPPPPGPPDPSSSSGTS